jgi:hypothetical protein
MVKSPELNQGSHQTVIILRREATITELSQTVIKANTQNTIRGADLSLTLIPMIALRNRGLEIYRKEMNLPIGLKRKIKRRHEMLLSRQAQVSNFPFF